jgi:hypothetical protein
MHTSSLVIKVWDLLRNPWKIDTISCEWIMIEDLDGLTQDWISAIFLLQGVNGSSVKVLIQDLKATISDICELSGEEYDRPVSLRNKSITYSSHVSAQSLEDESLYDETIPRDWVHEMIDLQDAVRQLIYLDAPLVRIKPGNEYILDQFESWDDE